MEIVLCDAALESIDALVAEVVILPVFSDERPLKGVSALIDWRVCGRLSEELFSGNTVGLMGDAGRVVLRPQLRIESAILLGLGPLASFDKSRLHEACAAVVSEVDAVGAEKVVCALPGRSLNAISAQAALEGLLESVPPQNFAQRLTIVESSNEHRDLQSCIARHDRKHRVTL